MVDLFPNQIGAYYFRTGQHDLMYVPITDPEGWRAVSESVSQQLGNDGELSAFLYPPVVAALLSPFAEAPADVWRNVLFGLNVLLIFVMSWQIARLCADRMESRGYLWALAFVLLAYPMARAMKLGQIVPLLAVGTWAALLQWRRGREGSAGIIAGVVSALKLFPVALIVLPGLDRRWKSVAATVAAIIGIYAASISVLGLRVHEYWWNSMRAFGSLTNPFFGNQAPSGWLARLAYRHPLHAEIPFTDPLLTSSGLVIGAAVALITLIALWKRRGLLTRDRLPLSAGLLLAGVMLAIPTAWEHYWLFVLPSLGWAVHHTWRQGDRRFWEFWLAAATFLFLMKLTHFYGDSFFGRLASGSQTMGMIMFWVWCLRRFQYGPSREPA